MFVNNENVDGLVQGRITAHAHQRAKGSVNDILFKASFQSFVTLNLKIAVDQVAIVWLSFVITLPVFQSISKGFQENLSSLKEGTKIVIKAGS